MWASGTSVPRDICPSTRDSKSTWVERCRGGPSGGYFLPNKMNLPEAKQGEYLTDHLTTQALKIIDNWQDEPFFLHFAYYTVHTPIQGKPDLVRQYQPRVSARVQHTPTPPTPPCSTVLTRAWGESSGNLSELKIADRTVILFTSDNGGLTQRLGKKTNITNNAPLRRGKGAAYEGGVRVPMIVHWPGVTKAGSSCDTPVMTIDYFPTIMQITAAGLRVEFAEQGGREKFRPVVTEENRASRGMPSSGTTRTTMPAETILTAPFAAATGN